MLSHSATNIDSTPVTFNGLTQRRIAGGQVLIIGIIGVGVKFTFFMLLNIVGTNERKSPS